MLTRIIFTGNFPRATDCRPFVRTTIAATTVITRKGKGGITIPITTTTETIYGLCISCSSPGGALCIIRDEIVV